MHLVRSGRGSEGVPVRWASAENILFTFLGSGFSFDYVSGKKEARRGKVLVLYKIFTAGQLASAAPFSFA